MRQRRGSANITEKKQSEKKRKCMDNMMSKSKDMDNTCTCRSLKSLEFEDRDLSNNVKQRKGV